MRRRTKKKQLLGWEYVGEYIAIDHEVTMYGVPRTKEEVDGIVAIAMRSLSNPTGHWHGYIEDVREKVQYILENEPSSADAQKLRSLGLQDQNLINQDFVTRVAQWEKFYTHKAVEFVRYDEDMYKFVKEGSTTHDANGKLIKSTGKPCAKASDWYAVLDQIVDG
jgi:hypothetical protein